MILGAELGFVIRRDDFPSFFFTRSSTSGMKLSIWGLCIHRMLLMNWSGYNRFLNDA
jgi:hypothetical protein